MLGIDEQFHSKSDLQRGSHSKQFNRNFTCWVTQNSKILKYFVISIGKLLLTWVSKDCPQLRLFSFDKKIDFWIASDGICDKLMSFDCKTKRSIFPWLWVTRRSSPDWIGNQFPCEPLGLWKTTRSILSNNEMALYF